jgi:hypothetical protein
MTTPAERDWIDLVDALTLALGLLRKQAGHTSEERYMLTQAIARLAEMRPAPRVWTNEVQV